MNQNNCCLDLGKVSYANFHWENQEGQCLTKKPSQLSVRSRVIPKDEMARPHLSYPWETMIERAKRLEIVDTWTAVCHFQLSNNHSLTYKGKKAIALWKTWQAKIYGTK